MEKLKGIGASAGISGVAKTFVIKEEDFEIKQETISDIESEIKKYEDAILVAEKQLEEIKAESIEKLGAEQAEIFEAHINILKDPEFGTQIKGKVEAEKVNASWATKEIKDMFSAMFAGMDDPYMQERAADINDVFDRVIKIIEGVEIQDLSKINEDVVIVAFDLTPSQSSQLNPEFVKGFITEIGGRTSHAAIISRTLGIPAIVGVGEDIKSIVDGEEISIDGSTGEIFYKPDEETKVNQQKAAERFAELQKEIKEFINKETVSKDGWKTKVAANIGSPADIDGVIKNGADGVGLFRSEFLYMDNSDWPTEEEQFEAYKKVLEGVDHTVVIRTLDIGGDKKLNYYKFPEELNPFLGYRAIRFQLDNEENLITQGRALVRASKFGKLAINIPMISTVEEFLKVKEIFKKIEDQLTKEGIEFGEYQLGIMVESPASVMLADKFINHADFFSIGSNDLIQYTFAADRMNAGVSYLYQPLNPALLRMLKMTIDASHAQDKWTAVCGEIASYPILTPILVGLGLDEFSMTATAVPEIRRLISKINKSEAEKLVEEVLNLETEEQVKEAVLRFSEERDLDIQ